jgi:hypothetical protein
MIVDELHCSSLLVLGSELKRVALVLPLALERALRVTVRPRLIDGPPTAVLAAFDAADLAEGAAPSARRRRAVRRLRAQPLRPRDVAGEGFHDRIGPRLVGGAPGADVHARLNALPARAAAACRRRFGIPLTYCAGRWEQVDREPFHLVSLDRHRATYNAATPRAPAARPRRARKAARHLGFRLLHLRRRRPTRPRRRVSGEPHPHLATPPERGESTQAGHLAERPSSSRPSRSTRRSSSRSSSPPIRTTPTRSSTWAGRTSRTSRRG